MNLPRAAPTDSRSNDSARPDTRELGVALSGGGVRAAAFALGALLYLVDTGLNKRVKVISSVSGASLTNGFVVSIPTQSIANVST